MLSRRMQIRFVRELLNGKERSFDRRQMDAPWREIYEYITEPEPFAVEERWRALFDWLTENYPGKAGGEIYQTIKDVEEETPAFESFAELGERLEPIQWFWRRWIPNSLLTVLAAEPGAGKSMVALDLARRVIQGQPCPDGSPLNSMGPNVIYVDAENVPQITLERANQWNMELGRMYPMLPPPYGQIDLNAGEDRDQLIEMVSYLNPGLVIIDSLSTISSRGDKSVEEVRPIFSFLTSLAEDAGCAMVLVHHTRKRMQNMLPGMEMTMDDLRGSGHIIAAARSILGLSIVQTGPKGNKNGPRKLTLLKTNMDAYPEPIGVQFVPAGKGVTVEYGDAPVTYQEPTKAEECGEWLVLFLAAAGKPIKPAEIIAAAEEEGFSRATVFRARDLLGERIANTLPRKDPSTEWELVTG